MNDKCRMNVLDGHASLQASIDPGNVLIGRVRLVWDDAVLRPLTRTEKVFDDGS